MFRHREVTRRGPYRGGDEAEGEGRLGDLPMAADSGVMVVSARGRV